MSDQSKRTWEGAGFDDADDGFMKNEEASGTPKRVVVPPSPQSRPPAPPSRSRSAGTSAIIVVMVILILGLGGVILWRTFLDIDPTDPDRPVASQTPAPDREVSTKLDSGIVVRTEGGNHASANGSATSTEFQQQDAAAAARASSSTKQQTRPVEATQVEKSTSAMPADVAVAAAPVTTKVPSRSEKALESTSRPESKGKAEPARAEPAPKTEPVPKEEPVLKTVSAPKGMPASAKAASATTAMMAVTPAPKGTPVYVVQVFASPDRQDAEEWLQLLRSRRVQDAMITEQRVKGETWYRVRFGQFNKRQDAEHAALKVGVAQPWIARVK
ncbi:MAG: hypothetical protein FGM24_05665 [Candidatus Kapabacteria bacterium]|nr:hypothetical protein [Candidatus Kapabacteria bacterium]